VMGVYSLYTVEVYTGCILYTPDERVCPCSADFEYKEVMIKILRNYPRILFNFNNLMADKSFAVN